MPHSETGSQVQRYVAWFHELDAWTEYWDLYHPETRGRFYFGDGRAEPGLLTRFLPRDGRPPPFVAWTRMALYPDSPGQDRTAAFGESVHAPEVSEAVMEVDDLVARLFGKHFGDAADREVRRDYLEGILLFATDMLPPATERAARIAADDPRARTAGRHTLDGDIMWFAWAVELEAAHLVARRDTRRAFHSLLMAGIAIGCPANYAWRGHRRTRSEYGRNGETRRLLHARGMQWASDFNAAAGETRALFRIREWGEQE
jgi:hypothetical protein